MTTNTLAVVFFFIVGVARAQVQGPEPFSEAMKAMKANEELPKMIDSLRKVYAKRWTIGMIYGQRFISAGNQALLPDTLTFADFRDQRSFFGLETSYFVNDRLQLIAGLDMLFLPKQQSIQSFSFSGPNGLEVEGSGAGGVMLNLGLGARYFLLTNRFGRPYLGLKVGNIRAVAKGGEGGITASRGQFQNVREQQATYAYLNPTAGWAHRMTPGFGVNLNIGYMYATRSQSLGRMTSPGGVTTTLTLEIIIGARKE